jgi:hypothetical protein
MLLFSFEYYGHLNIFLLVLGTPCFLSLEKIPVKSPSEKRVTAANLCANLEATHYFFKTDFALICGIL